MWQDLRFALRQLRKSPIFALVAVFTLALGIGANTAIFTLLDQALLRMLPVSHPEQLVRLRFEGLHNGNVNFYGGDEHDYFSLPAYRELRDKNSVFSGVIANSEAQVGVRWNNQPELASAELVSGNYFDTLGVQPALGRLLIPADDAADNSNPVVALSFNYWKTRFNSDPGIVGKALLINGQPFTIIGVIDPGFKSAISGYAPKVFFPLSTTKLVNPGMSDSNDVRSAWLTIEARLKPGETGAGAKPASIRSGKLFAGSSWCKPANPRNWFDAVFCKTQSCFCWTTPADSRPCAMTFAFRSHPDGHGGTGSADGLRERV